MMHLCALIPYDNYQISSLSQHYISGLSNLISLLSLNQCFLTLSREGKQMWSTIQLFIYYFPGIVFWNTEIHLTHRRIITHPSTHSKDIYARLQLLSFHRWVGVLQKTMRMSLLMLWRRWMQSFVLLFFFFYETRIQRVRVASMEI